MSVDQNKIGAPRQPLQAICPYFAMFPEEFVRKMVKAYSKKGDWIFDPFCGRGTSVLESLLLGRKAAGLDINPVAFCVSKAKASFPQKGRINNRIDELARRYENGSLTKWERKRLALPPFFRRAFNSETLREILFLRESLDWKNGHADCFIAALILGSLHGEMDKSKAYFSNQMPRTICLKPDYSLRYWRKNNLFPKRRKVFGMLRQKVEYRLKALPRYSSGIVRLADVRRSPQHLRSLRNKVGLVITSPPYFNVTRYEEDQWLRLWFLGGDPRPTCGKISKDDRHSSPDKYWKFITDSWQGIAPLLKDSAKIVIRLGALGLDEPEMVQGLKDSISEVFPKARLLHSPERSAIVGRQTPTFLPLSTGCLFELDFVFKI